MSVYTQVKPLESYSEYDVVNFYALDAASGNKGEVVQIAGSGFISTQNLGMQSLYSNGDAYSPRWTVKAKVSFGATGVKPLGLLWKNVRETNAFGYPMMYGAVRKDEADAVVSGQAVPILRKGYVLYKMEESGWNYAGSGVAPSVGGKVLAPTHIGDAASIGTILGAADKDGYALLSINAY